MALIVLTIMGPGLVLALALSQGWYGTATLAGFLIAIGIGFTTVTSKRQGHAGSPVKRLGAFLIGLIVVLNLLALQNGQYVHQLIATIMLVVAFIPAFMYFRSRRPDVPLIPLFTIIFWVHFGLQVLVPFTKDHHYLDIDPADLTLALGLATAGLGVFVAAFYFVPTGRLLDRLPQLRDDWSDRKAKALALLLTFGGLLLFASDQLSLVPTTVIIDRFAYFANLLSILGTAMLLLFHLRGKLNPVEMWFLWLLLIPLHMLVLWGLGGGGPAARFTMVLAITYLAEKQGRFNLGAASALLGVFAVGIFLLIAVRPELRGFHGGDTPDEANLTQRVSLFAQTIQRFSSGDIDISDRTAAVTQRLDYMGMFAVVVRKTPGEVPYWGGETYKNIIWKPIPRFLFPSKPNDDVAVTFPRRYDIAHRSALQHTTVPMPYLAEMYGNFGTAGILIGMSLLGILFQVISRLFSQPGGDRWSLIVAATLGATLIVNQGANFSLVYGGLVLPLLFIWFLGRLVRPSSFSSQTSIPLTASTVAKNI